MSVTVASLRQNGYKVRVTHRRPYLTSHGEIKLLSRYEAELVGYNFVHPRGGETVVELTTREGETLTGMARCADLDQFNRRLGLQIALGRALTSR